MTRTKAIRIFCVECTGNDAQEVTLCGIKNCSLWEYRLGCGMQTNAYRLRVNGAWGRGGKVAKAARAEGQTLDFWLSKAPREALPAERRVGVGKVAGKASNGPDLRN